MLPCAFRLQSAVAQPGAGAGVGRARLCGLVGDCQRHMPCAMPRMRTPWGAGSGRRRGAADGLALLLCRAATTTPTTQQVSECVWGVCVCFVRAGFDGLSRCPVIVLLVRAPAHM